MRVQKSVTGGNTWAKKGIKTSTEAFAYISCHSVSKVCFRLKAVNMSVKWKKLAQAGGFGISSKDQIDSNDELYNMKDIEPELFIKFVRIPSLKTYTSLIKKLERCSKKWLTEFLVLGGLTSLFEVLEKLSERSLVRFSDAFLQLECVRCIKAVLNNVTGLEFITNDSSLTNQLVIGK